MTSNTIVYAMKRLKEIEQENDVKFHLQNTEIIIELRSGNNFKLHEDEIIYQAELYLNSELENLKDN